jgi:lysophospholipase L1-like esterase
MKLTTLRLWSLAGLLLVVGCGGGGPVSSGQAGSAGTGGSGASGTGGVGGTNSSGGRGGSAATAGSGAGGQPAGGNAGTPPTGGAAGGSSGSAGAAAGATGGGSAGARGGSGGASGSSGRGGSGTGGVSGRGGAAAGGASGGGGQTATDGGTDASAAYHPCPTDGTVCKLMPFGDSITDGYNADTPGGYRVELFRRAHAAGKNITFVGSGSNGPATVDGAPFPFNHEGHSGWTIAPEGSRSGISTLVSTVMPQFKPHIVLLMIGTNDAIDNYDMANAPKRLGALIDSIYAQLPNVLIVVAQPIPGRDNASKGDDTALSARIKTYDDAIPAIVKARTDAGKHILVVDMFTPFNPTKTSLLEDQWHPNLQGYVVLGTQWYAVLQSLL